VHTELSQKFDPVTLTFDLENMEFLLLVPVYFSVFLILLAHLAKGHVSFAISLASVIRPSYVVNFHI
jgi:hypothetical protein